MRLLSLAVVPAQVTGILLKVGAQHGISGVLVYLLGQQWPYEPPFLVHEGVPKAYVDAVRQQRLDGVSPLVMRLAETAGPVRWSALAPEEATEGARTINAVARSQGILEALCIPVHDK